MPAKKAKKPATKKPSAKQLAARKKFAAAAKARSKTAQGKKRGSLKNGTITRRKYRNGYLDLVIAGTAQRGPKGWKVGGKQIPYGKGIVPVKAGHYLDKATGTIFSRRARNSDHRDADHPISVVHHWRQGPPGYLTQWQRAHHAGQTDLFEHGIKPAKIRHNPGRTITGARSKFDKTFLEFTGRNAQIASKATGISLTTQTSKGKSRYLLGFPTGKGFEKRIKDAGYTLKIKSQALPKTKRRNPDSETQAIKNREEFAGHYGGMKTVYAPSGTPEGLARLGVLAALILADKSRLSFREQNTIFLAQDNQHRLHVVSSKPGAIVDNQAGDYGEVSKVEYIEAKPHLGESDPIQWVHKMGEVTGERPRLIVDSNGQLKLKGGAYSINWRGIIN